MFNNLSNKKGGRERNNNLYLNTEEDDVRVFENSNPDANKNYIIFQNDTLQKKNYELEKEKSEILKRSEEFECEVDKFDEQLRYIRGELKNFVELRLMEKQIADVAESKEKDVAMQLSESTKSLKRLILSLCVSKSLSMVIGILRIFNYDFSFGSLGLLTGDILFTSYVFLYYFTGEKLKCESNPFDLRQKQFEQKIKELKIKIKELDDSNDFIGKYIDNL